MIRRAYHRLRKDISRFVRAGWRDAALLLREGPSAKAVGQSVLDGLIGRAMDADSADLAEAVARLCRLLRRCEASDAILERLADRGLATGSAWTALGRAARRRGPDAAASLRARLPAQFLYHHLGLGDHLICCGLVRNLAAASPRVGLFAKKGYAASVRFLYRDLPSIEVIPVADDQEVHAFLGRFADLPVWRVGFEHVASSTQGFAEGFYRQYGLDYELRWSGFHLRRDRERESRLFERLGCGREPYVFLHDDPSRGLVIRRDLLPQGMRLVFPDRALTDNLFDWGMVLEKAAEIHCMDSSFRHLADCLQPETDKLFLHHYVKHSDVPSRHAWRKIC